MLKHQVAFQSISVPIRLTAFLMACWIQLGVVIYAHGQPCPGGCDDGDPCTADACVGGVCVHSPASGRVCADDGNPCTSDVCNNGVCTHPGLSGTACEDDGNPCTLDICSNGVCTYQEKVCPTDLDECTSNKCVAGQCQKVPNSGPCDNLPPCINGPGVCIYGLCVGIEKDCSNLDQGACIRGRCNPTTGYCQSVSICGEPYIYSPYPANGGHVRSPNDYFKWNPVPGAIGYDLYFGRKLPLEKIGSNLPFPTMPIPKIVPGFAYYWQVFAHLGAGASTNVEGAYANIDIQGPYWWFYFKPVDTTTPFMMLLLDK